MSRSICLRCRESLLQILGSKQRAPIPNSRTYSSSTDPAKGPLDIAALLSKPSWSVRSLLPTSTPKQEITPSQLHHLLRLSALPQPRSLAEEAKMLEDLHSQLHFVRDIQSVDTEGVQPLQSIRDETEEGLEEATIGLESLKETLKEEVFVGRNKRPRRTRKAVEEMKEVEGGWDVFKMAGETVSFGGSRYFVVRSGRDDPEETPKKEVVENGGYKDTQQECKI